MSDETAPHREGMGADGGTDVVGDGNSLERRSRSGMDSDTTADRDHEFLLEVIRRRPLLRSLASGGASTGEILDAVDMSRSTVHRALNSLMDGGLVKDCGDEYRLTSVGQIVLQESETFGTRAATALSLDQFLNAINGHAASVPVEHFTEATVVRRKDRQPHATIHRIIEFIEQAEHLRMFSTVISPVYVDVGYHEMMDGMSIEAIFDEAVVDIMLAEHPEKAYETISTGNFDVHAHAGLPFELFISEDKVGMAAHNDTGNAEILVECRDPAAVEWAEDLYSQHLSDAEPLTL